AIREKQEAEQRAEDVEKQLKSLEDRRKVLQPIMDNDSKEIKEYGMIRMFLQEAGTFERAVPYRENKIKQLFIKMKNQ
ncbi:recombinase, partial [Blautia wexlerae]|nr:recombinase [Blautia wexlerae]